MPKRGRLLVTEDLVLLGSGFVPCRLVFVRVAVVLVLLVGLKLVAYQCGRLGLRSSSHRPERLALGALDLGRVGASAPLEVQVLADRVVE
jgi:hypothetical protein